MNNKSFKKASESFIINNFGLYGCERASSFFRKGTEFRNSIDFIDEEMTGTMDIRVRVEGSMKDPKILSEIETKHGVKTIWRKYQ